MIDVYTSVATNYIPKARVLGNSFKKYCPQARLHLLIADKLPEGFTLDDEPFDNVITLADLNIPDSTRWAFKHRIVELCTAVKPWAAEYLFNKGSQKVFYFDPDIALFSGIEDLIQKLDSKSVLLTPHLDAAEDTDDGVRFSELSALRHGIYNLGFLGVSNTEAGRTYIQWWKDRTYDYCYDDIEAGVFTDQKWNDLAHLFFEDLEILREPVYNVATWNYTKRKLSGSIDSGVFVNGQPLVFHHFSGYDHGAHKQMLEMFAAGSATAHELDQWYEAECAKQAQSSLSKVPWSFGSYSDGSFIERNHRLLYKEKPDLQERFPDPFDAKGYYAWLQEHGLVSDSMAGFARQDYSLVSYLGEVSDRLRYFLRNRRGRLPFLSAALVHLIRLPLVMLGGLHRLAKGRKG